MKIVKAEEHYDKLIDENHDPVYDDERLVRYMDNWDGEVFIDKLSLTGKDDVLEIGVGTGRLAMRVCMRCQSFAGIDLSHKTIAKARINLSKFKYIHLICAEFLDYIFPNKFHLIYSSLTFLHIKEKYRAISKIASLLHSGGKFVLSIDKNQDQYLVYNDR